MEITITVHEVKEHKPPKAKRSVRGAVITTPSGYFEKEFVTQWDLLDVLEKEQKFAAKNGGTV